MLEFPLAETISIQDLIRLKVEEEARRLATLGALDQQTKPARLGREYQEISATRQPRPPADWPAEVHTAQQAFAAGRFMILVNGRRYVRLDEQVTLAPQTQVKFIRLMPLMGG